MARCLPSLFQTFSLQPLSGCLYLSPVAMWAWMQARWSAIALAVWGCIGPSCRMDAPEVRSSLAFMAFGAAPSGIWHPAKQRTRNFNCGDERTKDAEGNAKRRGGGKRSAWKDGNEKRRRAFFL